MAASISNIRRFAKKTLRVNKQTHPKLESEDTLVDIKLKSMNETETNTANVTQPTASILKDSPVTNIASSEISGEELDQDMEISSPFKPRNRSLVCRTPPDTPKIRSPNDPTKSRSRVDIIKQQVDTPKLSPAATQTEISNLINTQNDQKIVTTHITKRPSAPKKSPEISTPPRPPPTIFKKPLPKTPFIAGAAAPIPGPLLHDSNEDWQQHLHTSQLRQKHRAAKVAAAAGAAAGAAQMRLDALEAIACKRQPNQPPQPRTRQLDQQRGVRNMKLLQSALNIIREMDAAYLEKLCYAIHDQLSKADSLD